MYFRNLIFFGVMAIMLSACGGGSSDDSEDSSGLGQTELSVEFPAAVAAVEYYFQPDYSGLSGEVTFSALDLPEWASVDPNTGAIQGTPDDVDIAPEVPVAVEGYNASERVVLRGILRVEDTAEYRFRDALDFYSDGYNGDPRILRNDLVGGDLQGEVQFVQSHSVAPSGNFERNQSDETQSRYMSRVVALREALLLFIPENGLEPVRMDVEVSVAGGPVATLPMQHPNRLPESDFSGARAVQYSTRAWSVVLPWDSVKNGLSLRFVANRGSSDELFGSLPSSGIDIGDASQIVFQSIRLGMLTHVDHANGHYSLRDPIAAASDYFETLPVSKLVMASYADMELDRVIIGSGRIYDSATDGASDTEGSVYSGDMRSDVAKSQVSVGINMANFGYTSHNMRQSYPHVFKQITNHHAWGMYQNGRISHGLSGGNGIGTLYASWGNEASHEWGHAYGLGHYPGKGLTEDGRWAVHHADSGWGYIAHRNRMRSNITDVLEEGGYSYNRDAMSGGYDSSPLSVYTHYTGYSARIIQNDLAGFPVPDAAFSSGYKKWNTESGQYENFDSSHPAPKKVGVPVATILGGYDPDGDAAVIYPVFHGNYGNIFALAEPDLNSADDQCWVEVSNAANEQKLVKMAAIRHHQSTINQLHFNLETDFRPTSADLYCRRDGVTEVLASTMFSGEIPPLPPVAIVGQEAGFSQLRDRELTEIEDALAAMENSGFNVLAGDLALKVASYTDEELEQVLSSGAWKTLNRLRGDQQLVSDISLRINYAKRFDRPRKEVAEEITGLLIEGGFIESVEELAVSGDTIRGNGVYFDDRLTEDQYVALTEVPEDLTSASRWTMDQQGRIHPDAAPWQCLRSSGSRVGLALCSGDAAQRWVYDSAILQLKNKNSGKCLDYDRANKRLITYGCTQGWNQKWSGVVLTDNRLLSLAGGSLLMEVYDILLPQ